MDIMDQEGMDFQSTFDRLTAPLGFGIAGPAAIVMRNGLNRMPLRSNWVMMAVTAPIGFAMGLGIKRWREKINADNMAVMKHYVLTHPERFPEPERRRYKDMIKPWFAHRW